MTDESEVYSQNGKMQKQLSNTKSVLFSSDEKNTENDRTKDDSEVYSQNGKM